MKYPTVIPNVRKMRDLVWTKRGYLLIGLEGAPGWTRAGGYRYSLGVTFVIRTAILDTPARV